MSTEYGGSKSSGALEKLRDARDFIYALEDKLVHFFELYGVPFTYLAFGFVFFYFGMQKPLTVRSPVNYSVARFLWEAGVPTATKIPFLFIGFFEMSMGLLFLFRKLRLAMLLFIPHQIITFLSIILTPYDSWQPPWIELFGLQIPWALDWFSAFVFKNLIFISAFMLLAVIEFNSEEETGEEKEESWSHG